MKCFILIKVSPNLGLGFPGSSCGKESACNSGDPGLIPRLGRSTGEVIGYPLQYFREGNNYWPGESMDRGVWWAVVHGVTELDTTEQLILSLYPSLDLSLFDMTNDF